MKKCILNKNSREYKTLTIDFYETYKAFYDNLVRFSNYLKKEKLKDYEIKSYKREIKHAETCIYALDMVFYDTFKESIRSYEKRHAINDTYNIICKIMNDIKEV